MEASIITDTLNGNIHFCSFAIAFQQKTLLVGLKLVASISSLNLTNNTNCNRNTIRTLLLCKKDVANTGVFYIFLTIAQRSLDSLESILCYIEDLGTSLQSTIVVVSTYTIADTLMSKTLTVVVNDLQVVCDTVSSHLFAISPYSNNLQRVVASLQTYNVYTTIRAIVANQMLVNLSIISILTTLHIYIICLCRRKK